MKTVEEVRKKYFVETAVKNDTLMEKIVFPFKVFFGSEFLKNENKVNQIEEMFNKLFRKVSHFNSELSVNISKSTNQIHGFLSNSQAQIQLKSKLPLTIPKYESTRILVSIDVKPAHLIPVQEFEVSIASSNKREPNEEGIVNLDYAKGFLNVVHSKRSLSHKVIIESLIPNVISQTTLQIEPEGEVSIAILVLTRDPAQVRNKECELNDEGNTKKYNHIFVKDQYTVAHSFSH